MEKVHGLCHGLYAKFHYAEFVIKSVTLLRTFPLSCHGLNSIGATQMDLSFESLCLFCGIHGLHP